MDSPEPPKAPDPKETAAAQAAMNKETAVAQYGLNATNQKTPYGALTYKQIGTWEDGTPRFEAEQTLSDEQKAIFDLTNQTKSNLGKIGVEQSGRVGELLNTPFSLDNDKTEARINELASKRLDPMLQRQRQNLMSDLANRGITEGSEAWNNAMNTVGQQENDARNSLLLSGRGQAVQEAMTERNQPLNEIIALLSGSQIQAPNFVGTPQPGVAGVDYGGMVNAAHQSDMMAWQQDVQSQNAMMEGLFSLAAAPLGGWAYGGFGMPGGK